MTPTYAEIDDYLDQALSISDALSDAAIERTAQAEMPAIAVSAHLAKFLQILVASIGAKRVLEVGTLGGYSTLFLARGVGDGGHIDTLELESKHAEVARANYEAAGMSQRITVHVGPALQTLERLSDPYDFAFIDADKENNPGYFAHALRLVRSGGLIVIDNTVRGGSVLNAESTDPGDQGVRKVHDMIREESRVEATALQIVGRKEHDGFTLIRVK